MKDTIDTRTPDLLPTPKKRGRPATGHAMTPAERKREQRRRDQRAIWMADSPEWQGLTVTGLLEHMGQAVAGGYAGVAQAIANELIRRAAENKKP